MMKKRMIFLLIFSFLFIVPFGCSSNNDSVVENSSYEQIVVENGISYQYSEKNNGYFAINATETKTEINIPEKLTDGKTVVGIKELAFADQKNIVSVYFPDTLISIGYGCLNSYSCIEKLSLPFTGNYSGDNSSFCFVFGQTSNEKIPSTLKEVTLTHCNSVEDNVFTGCKFIQSISLGNECKSIGNFSFSCCSFLKEIIFPDNLLSIGSHAFKECDSLIDLILPDTVTSIGNRAFENCSSLKNVTLSNQLQEFGSYVFSDCENLTYHSDNGINYLGSKDNSNLVLINVYDKDNDNLFVAEGTRFISDEAFSYCKNLLKMDLPSSVIQLGNKAFYLCSKLEKVNFCSLKVIGDETFSGCYQLKEVSSFYLLERMGESCFSQCSQLTDISLSEKIKKIPVNTFYQCSALFSVNLSSETETIDNNAFYGCVALEKVSALNHILSLGSNAFRCCSSLKQLQVGDTLTSVGLYCFEGCDSLMGYSEDNICYLGNSQNHYVYLYKCRDSQILNVTIQSGCKIIGSNAFSYCGNLTSVTFDDDLTKIDMAAFSNCVSLTSLDFPESLVSIGNSAFEGCLGLSDISFDNSLSSIAPRAFYQCSSLTSVIIPLSVNYIGYQAVGECENLTKIYCESDNRRSGWNENFCDDTATLFYHYHQKD